jgi:hypothetical protein
MGVRLEREICIVWLKRSEQGLIILDSARSLGLKLHVVEYINMTFGNSTILILVRLNNTAYLVSVGMRID